MEKIHHDIIRQARKADLAKYLLEHGVKLIKNGYRFRHAEHESLIISGNAFFWNAKGTHGNAIDFLMSYFGLPFEDAVSELIGCEYHNFENADAGQQKKEKPEQCLPVQTFDLFDINALKNRDMRRAIAYLHKTRGIDYSILQNLIKEKYIYQENSTNNVLFAIRDELRNVVGAEVCGTLSERRYKGVKAGTLRGYGFNIPIGDVGSLKYALFFESAIDLISFYEIKKIEGKTLDACLLVSLAGLKESIIERTLTVFGSLGGKLEPVLCVDNDKSGFDLIKRLTRTHTGYRVHLPLKDYKDWNEQLLKSKKS